MAAVINDRDVLLQAATPRLIAVDLPPNVNLPASSTLNNVPIQTVIAGAASSGGDITTDILENSATAIVVTSSNLFTYPGTGSAGLFVGSGGIEGRDTSGNVTFSIASSDGDAEFAGTIKAGSVLVDSIVLQGSGRSLALIDAGATGYNQAQLEADLTSGVSNIIAGSGSDFVLDVNASSGMAAFKHKDAVYDGTAAAGSNKPALAITANGIAMGYNRSSDGAWQDAVAISSLGNVTVSGTISGQSVISTSASIFGTALSVQDLVDKANEPPPTGDNTVSILQNSGTTVTMSSSNLFKTTTGLGGVFIGGGGLFGKNTSGVDTFSIDGATGAASFTGTITGGSNIDITGKGVFRGQTLSAGQVASVVANPDKASGGFGIWAGCSTSGFSAVLGNSTGSAANGVSGVASDNGTALRGSYSGSGTGYGLNVTGRSRISGDLTVTGTLTATVSYATTAGTANSVSASNITGSINAATLGSRSSTEYCYRNLCNANGYTEVSGGDAGVRITGSLFDTVQTRASGNTVFIENKSDISLKTNIRPEYFGSDFIKKLKPCVFELKDRMGIDTHGFIAQEVAAEIPATDSLALKNEGSDFWGVSDTGLMSVAVNTIQEILGRLEAAESKITTLQAEVNLLKGI